ncbi:MAG TPA: 16S rRNA (cytosine(967)-C(5))-methyltransferase RsmB [Terriglobales bacterium]|nr:16S rRNA (cytosine(967)-C(5))-methyltransferase RsmB [Terriglobales bacterium]
MLSPARSAAFDILLKVEQQKAYASELLNSARLAHLSSADRALCTELVMGVLRWQSRLDHTLADLVSKPVAKLDPEVLLALRLAVYQIMFLQRIPAHASVNDSVELVKRKRKRSAAPFVNAVLRKLAANPISAEPVLAPGPTTVPDLVQIYAHPLWLVDRWAVRYGLERAAAICAYDQKVPPTSIRLLDPSAERELMGAGIEISPGLLMQSARRIVAGDVTSTTAFRDGRITIQDEGSQLVAHVVAAGNRILDCCAAPGGKTILLAARNPNAQVIAAELHPQRASAMQARVAHLSSSLAVRDRIRIVAADVTRLPFATSFDSILADVPCSGTGTLARHPEIKWRLTLDDLADLHSRQISILTSALDRLSPGGCLLYCSCSLEPEENEEVVREVLRQKPDFRLVDCKPELTRLRQSGELIWPDLDSLLDGSSVRTFPGIHPCDGFFAAMIMMPSVRQR